MCSSRARSRFGRSALTWSGATSGCLIGRPSLAAKVRELTMAWPGNWRREKLWDLDFRWNYALGIFLPSRADGLRS